MFEGFELIHRHTRAQAIEDGYLVDVTTTAKEAGFRFPVALTRAVWDDCVSWTRTDTTRKRWPQDEAGRLWDVLWMASLAVRAENRSGVEADRVRFVVLRVPREGRGCKARRVMLVAHVGPGDAGEAAITVMQPDED